MREESRGAHTRTDYPDERDGWLKYNIVIKKNDEGTMGVEKVLRKEPSTELKRIASLTIEEMEAEVKVGQSRV
jgi:succinate dehydrogenase/fumarate reductase flavoprotein subunit